MGKKRNLRSTKLRTNIWRQLIRRLYEVFEIHFVPLGFVNGLVLTIHFVMIFEVQLHVMGMSVIVYVPHFRKAIQCIWLSLSCAIYFEILHKKYLTTNRHAYFEQFWGNWTYNNNTELYIDCAMFIQQKTQCEIHPVLSLLPSKIHKKALHCSPSEYKWAITAGYNNRHIWYDGAYGAVVISYGIKPMYSISQEICTRFCFAVLCCSYTLTDLPISIRLTSLALWQSNDCPSASKATLMNMDKYFMWIHYERLHNHNNARHNKTVCIFLGIYCNRLRFQWVFLPHYHHEWGVWCNISSQCMTNVLTYSCIYKLHLSCAQHIIFCRSLETFLYIFYFISKALMSTTFHEICHEISHTSETFHLCLYQHCSYSHDLGGPDCIPYEVDLHHSYLTYQCLASPGEIGLKTMIFKSL